MVTVQLVHTTLHVWCDDDGESEILPTRQYAVDLYMYIAGMLDDAGILDPNSCILN